MLLRFRFSNSFFASAAPVFSEWYFCDLEQLQLQEEYELVNKQKWRASVKAPISDKSFARFSADHVLVIGAVREHQSRTKTMNWLPKWRDVTEWGEIINCDTRQGQLILATGAKAKGTNKPLARKQREKLPSMHAHTQARSSCSCTVRIHERRATVISWR